jgi:hypothetical protein
MSSGSTARVVVTWAVAVALSITKDAAAAENHRVAAVDPDMELTHALDLALSPWGATVVEVRLQAPGGTMPIAVERARDIAREVQADVVVWVSSAEGGYALWIYDADSDHTSSRGLETAPPFDGETAAGIALAVKTLLRGTVVAPPLERFGAPVHAPTTWRVGASLGESVRLVGSPVLFEPRAGLSASWWPAAWRRHWGLSLDAEAGPGAQVSNDTLVGSVHDVAARLSLAASFALSETLGIETSLGPSVHVVQLDGVVLTAKSPVSETRVDVAIEPRLGLSFATFGGRLSFTPWVGMSVLTRWQRFLVQGAPAVDLGALGAEGALSAALALP